MPFPLTLILYHDFPSPKNQDFLEFVPFRPSRFGSVRSLCSYYSTNKERRKIHIFCLWAGRKNRRKKLFLTLHIWVVFLHTDCKIKPPPTPIYPHQTPQIPTRTLHIISKLLPLIAPILPYITTPILIVLPLVNPYNTSDFRTTTL